MTAPQEASGTPSTDTATRAPGRPVPDTIPVVSRGVGPSRVGGARESSVIEPDAGTTASGAVGVSTASSRTREPSGSSTIPQSQEVDWSAGTVQTVDPEAREIVTAEPADFIPKMRADPVGVYAAGVDWIVVAGGADPGGRATIDPGIGVLADIVNRVRSTPVNAEDDASAPLTSNWGIASAASTTPSASVARPSRPNTADPGLRCRGGRDGVRSGPDRGNRTTPY